MFEAPEGLVVVQTAAGLNLYNPEKENFDRRPEPFLAKYEASVELTDIIRDRDGGFWFVQPDKLMGEYGTFRRNGSNHVPLDLATHNDAVDYWITFVTRQTKANGIIPFWWDTGGVLYRKNNTVKDQRTHRCHYCWLHKCWMSSFDLSLSIYEAIHETKKIFPVGSAVMHRN